MLAVSLGGANMPRAAHAAVPRWEPSELTFTSTTAHGNPFLVRFEATAAGPVGERLRLPGFYDGDRTWRLRFAPPAPGRWQIRTSSDDPQLDGQTRTVEAEAKPRPGVHGGLRVDPEHPHHFVFEDGTRYFLMGYECDWLWALDLGEDELRTLEPFLDKLAASGFNHVLMNAYAHDTAWCPGHSQPGDLGPPVLFAWEGTNERPDHTRFGLAYWQHYDRVIRAMHERGLIAHLMIKVYNKLVDWPAPGSPEDDLYFRWLVARYAAFPNVVWDFSKEGHNEPDAEYKLSRFRLLRQSDPYRRLITEHDDDDLYDRGVYDGLLDFRTDQQHGNWHETILAQRRRHRWPVLNAEFGYEHGPRGLEDRTYGVVQPPEEVARRAWEIAMGGGYPAYYYTYTAWDVIRPGDTPPGYAYFRHLRDFFARVGYWALEPADEVVNRGYCLARPGEEYVVYLEAAGPVTLQLAGAAGSLAAEWFSPLTGERRAAPDVRDGAVTLEPPPDWQDRPVALHVGRPPDSAAAERRVRP